MSVVGGDEAEVIRLDDETFLERGVEAAIHRLNARAPRRSDRSPESASSSPPPPRCSSAAGTTLFTSPMRYASAASVISAGEHELQRASLANETRQPLRAAVARTNAELHLGESIFAFSDAMRM